ncbi:MAG: pyrroline-5-carboxylate reductase [Lysobacterales bacterium]
MTRVIAFVGGGNMARSLIGGLRAQAGELSIRVAEPNEPAREALAREFDVACFANNADAVPGADVVVLAVKPQVMRDVCRALAPLAQSQRTLWVSIAAGIRMRQLNAWLGGNHAIVRAMPNTPALIGAGITGLVANAIADQSQRALAESILRGAGETVWIDREELMDAVTAVSGSGPAYFLLLMEALERAAIEQGLPASAARALVLQTALGAARMAVASDQSPGSLRQRVTSPGGTTAAAIGKFEAGGFDALVSSAVAAATRRGVELADEFS